MADTTPADAGQTPETYLGAERAQYYDGAVPDQAGVHQFTAPATLTAGEFGLSGSWTVAAQSITAGSGAVITESYHAARVYLDVGGTGTLTVTSGGSRKTIRVSGAPDIYTVASSSSAVDGIARIALSPGLQAYSLTFG